MFIRVSARTDNIEAGYCEGDPDKDTLTLYVQENYRRRGLASQLFHVYVERCKQHGLNQIRFLVRNDNQIAKSFYKKQGCAMDDDTAGLSWCHKKF